MKKTLTILFGVLFFTVAPFSAQAQFLDKLSKKWNKSRKHHNRQNLKES